MAAVPTVKQTKMPQEPAPSRTQVLLALFIPQPVASVASAAERPLIAQLTLMVPLLLAARLPLHAHHTRSLLARHLCLVARRLVPRRD